MSLQPATSAQRAIIRGLRVTRRLIRKRGKKGGMAPGSVVHTGEKRVEEVKFHVIRFGPDAFEERDVASPAECFPAADSFPVTWLNIDGLHDTTLLSEVARLAGLHPLVIEDIVSTGQRPKQEAYGEQLYIVLRMLRYDRDQRQIDEEQVSIVVGPRYVLSFQESGGDVWDPVRERLRQGKGHARTRGADYLAYTLMDAVVDEYFNVVEAVGDHLGELEEEVTEHPSRGTVAAIYALKGELLVLRKAVWPLRDLFNSLVRDEFEAISEGTRVFLRDAYDHAVQVIDNVETMRDLSGGLIDIYLSSVSNRMNEVMKVLTLIATIFIPLTFIVGIYGMNFEFMPELHWRWAYPVVWVIMLAIGTGMLVLFKRKSWL